MVVVVVVVDAGVVTDATGIAVVIVVGVIGIATSPRTMCHRQKRRSRFR